MSGEKSPTPALLQKVAPLFAGWQQALLPSCLEGCMGEVLADDAENPTSAQIVVGDFCFFAGRADRAMASRAAAPIIVAREPQWKDAIRAVWGDEVTPHIRYAICENTPAQFDTALLQQYAAALPPGYRLARLQGALFDAARAAQWSRDLVSQFSDAADFAARGLGFLVLHGEQGRPVAGASSYVVYQQGIEIEIDTAAPHRRRGLAAACGAALVLECLHRGLYPGWDAHDLRSVALAEKMGYRRKGPYEVFVRRGALGEEAE